MCKPAADKDELVQYGLLGLTTAMKCPGSGASNSEGFDLYAKGVISSYVHKGNKAEVKREEAPSGTFSCLPDIRNWFEMV